MARDFEDILAESAVTHGHMCPGQVLGVRMGMLGLALLGYDAPLDNRNIKKVVVVAEIDRCASDALVVATGVRLGRRSLKFYDYGLMAATFVNLPDGRAIRISINDDCKLKVANVVSPLLTDPVQREITAYKALPATDLFLVERVQVDLKPEDLPGYHASKAVCEACGSIIRHRREVTVDGRTLCRPCAGGAYFTRLDSIKGFDSLDPVYTSRQR